MTPRATYRFQFHAGFTFADAEALVPYLAALGISHLYASPITVAAPGSTHGYDVVDPTRINPELGGEEGFRSLVASLKRHGLGCVIDIVPNHMGVAGGSNPWWNDVLRHGQASEFAPFFDIDWRRRIVLPVLGAPLEQILADRAIAVERGEDGRWQVVAYGEHRFPVRDEDQEGAESADLAALLDRQHYRLAWWRVANDELNWRRFFTVSELAGLRIEDDAVFEATHALYFRLHADGLIDGVRVDHVDGLTDPAYYCRKLRDRLGPDAWIVIEKILGEGEVLATDWGVDGTSGYDFMEEVAALLHEPEGEAPLARLWGELSGRSPDYAPEELAAKQDMLAWAFEGQLEGCVDALAALARSAPDTAGLTAGMLRRAAERMLWCFPVYRTYGCGTFAPASDAVVRETVRDRAGRFTPLGEAAVTDRLLAWLAGEGPGDPALAAEAVRRFQQLSAPINAKAVEDTAFYRYGRLLSRNDVGFAPATFARGVAAFHERMAVRARDWPGAMLTTATHDHKRGEDVRARLAVLSELPGAWRERVEHWAMLVPADGVDPGDRYMLMQTLFGAWPGDDLAGFADRVNGWQQKALREAKLRSSWEAPDTAYEARCTALTEALLGSDMFVADMRDWVAHTAAPALANSLAQVALRCTVPGVPDLYQSAELADLSLVDPDNRRPVDYGARARLLAGGNAKLDLIRRLLAMRAEAPALFADGSYRPLDVTGHRAAHLIAFEREGGGRRLRVMAALHAAETLAGQARPIAPDGWWGDTAVAGEPVAGLLAEAPVSIRWC